MKVLLCLLSGQHVPNLLSVHHIRPDRLVLVETPTMQGKAKDFRAALKLGDLDFTRDDRCHVVPLEAEDTLDSVRKCLQHAHERFPAAEWFVNLTGGTKPMSIAAYEFSKEIRARPIYVNVEKPNLLLNLEDHAAEICTHRPTIREFLAGYGFEFRKKPEDIANAEERARGWWPCATQIAQQCPQQPLLRLGDLQDTAVKKHWDDARKKGLELVPGVLAPEDPELRKALVALFSLRDAPEGLCGKLDSYGVDFLTSGWLEVFLWQLLQRHADALRIWDVRLGLHPAKIGVQTDSEFDVAFMHNYRLCMVECKSGSQENDPRTEILEKVEAVVRQFGALGIRSCLATTSPNVLGKDGQLKPNIRDRAGIYRCRILVRDEIRELARTPDNVEAVRKLILDKQSPQ